MVYAVDDEKTIDKVSDFWLPTVQKVLGEDHGKPVILVGNKSDTNDNNDANVQAIVPIMNEYPEIETCVECSAKTLKNISELFYYAQKAVLHPTGPLYLPEDKEVSILSQGCKKALVRIFKICDQDNDGLLNDYELNNFQFRCFGCQLTDAAIAEVKNVVIKHISDGILDNALTLKGFLYLHTLFIQRGRHETTWTVLRKFGYDNSLQLSKDYLYPALKVPRGCSTELNYEGMQFLTALFEKYDEDKDGCLSPTELQNLFSVCPVQPWGPDVLNSCQTNDQGWLNFNGYLSYWMLQTLLDLPRTLEYLAYLGFNTTHPDQLSAVTVTRDKRIDWQKRDSRRSVYMCHVIGPKGAGKTALLQGFLKKNLQRQAGLNKRQLSSYSVNTVYVNGKEKYLLLHEIDVLSPEDALTAYELSCDVVCLLYDMSDPFSFEYCARMYKKYFHRTKLPCLVVGTRKHDREVLQQYDVQPAEFCARYRLNPPIGFSAADEPSWDVYMKLATLAVFPHLKNTSYLHDGSLWVKASLLAAGAAVLGFVVFKNL